MSNTSLPSPNKKHCVLTPPSDEFQFPSTSSSSGGSGSSGSMEAAAGTSVSQNSQSLRKSDEVAQIRRGVLVFGILEHPIKEKDKAEKVVEWKVRWNNSDSTGVTFHCPLTTTERSVDLTFTDRALYKGCKVRKASISDGLVGICRDVLVSVDLRVLGTATVVTGVNIDMFKHLKEFKQKSVVYKSGWLGVVSDVKRLAQVRLVDPGLSCEVALNHIRPVGALEVEVPWINEEVPGINFQPSLARFTDENSFEKLTKQSIKSLFIEDLIVEQVTVQWRYQVDVMRPDKPPDTITGARLKDLQIVMEELSSDVSFQVGNLGRYKITSQTEFVSMCAYSAKFVHSNMGGEAAVALLKAQFERPKYAYDPDPEKRLAPDNTAVVEIVHANTVGDIIWQDGTMDWVPGKDLIVQDGSLLDNILTPGDFMYSNELRSYGTIDEIYAVVTRYDLQSKLVTVKVLTCASPPKLVNSLCVSESALVHHWKYKHFNQANTVVVLQRNERTCVGHVRRTNLDGKVQVLWLHNQKEEWVWPADCSVYSVKGHDLECVISLINDEDETKEVDLYTRFLRLTQGIRRISEIWSETPEEVTEEDGLIKLRRASVTELRTILHECRQIEDKVNANKPDSNSRLYSDATISEFSAQIGLLIEEKRKTGDRGKPKFASTYTQSELVETMTALCAELLKRGEKLDAHFGKKDDGLRSLSSSEPMDTQPLTCTSALARANICSTTMDTDSNEPTSSTQTGTAPATATPDAGIFDCSVVVEDSHPEGHTFASKTEFQPTQLQYFIKIVKNELNNLRDQCPPGIKVKAYGDRYDLFSILIRGPVNTPYEDTLYLFDAMLPPTYPAVPPKFHFHSYRAGRLNPNLYAEGTVCVSLLGTWSSPNHQEKWTKESNIVQVLLSIQALILVSEPYHNEPGLEADKYDTATARKHCHLYNADLLPKIMKMMVNQIEHPMDPWKEETQAFYKATLPKFLARWQRWLEASENSSKRDECLEKLGDEKPEFEIYPMEKKFKDAVQANLEKLRLLLAGLEAGGDGGALVIRQEEAGEARRAEEPGMAAAEDQEPDQEAAMEVDLTNE